jgi:hypothetical protein
MGKMSSVLSSQPASTNGGIMGSGIHGMVGSTVLCKADDNSFFCSLTKIFSGTFMIILLLIIFCFIVYFIWNFSYYYKMLFPNSK